MRRCLLPQAAGVGFALALLLAACDSSVVATATPTALKSPPPISQLRSISTSSFPAEPAGYPAREASNPDPSFDTGYVVQITPSGFHPTWLISPCCSAIVWLNLTNAPNSIVFDALGIQSGAIPSGGSFTFTPHNVESIAYHSIIYASMTGVVQVNQLAER